MYAVLFEFEAKQGRFDDYYAIALELRPDVDKIDGFLGIERFASRATPDRYLSLSTWRDEAAIAAWREFQRHRAAQAKGRGELFADYRLRVGEVVESGGTVTAVEGRGLSGGGEVFDSVVTPGKTLILGAEDVSGAIDRTLRVQVLRDYGMFSRDEAPRRNS